VKNKIFIVGIDYSINSPGVSIIDIDKPFELKNIKTIVFTKRRKSDYDFKNVTNITIENEYENSIIKYNYIANHILKYINDNDVVALEGYSFGSRGSLIFNIAEHTGLLKYKLWRNNILFNVFSPNTIKKFATNKGNSDKEGMYEALCKKFDI